MGRFVFTGRVIPERSGFDYDQTVILDEVQVGAAELKFRVEFQIRRAQVIALVDAEDSADVLTIRNYLGQVIRRLIDTVTYLSGGTHDLEITSVLKPDGQFIVFDASLVGLQIGEKALNLQEVWTALIAHATLSSYAAQALADLREAIRHPHDTGFSAYHGIDAIRQSFAAPSDGTDRRKSFNRMRDSLRVERSYMDWVGEFRKTQAHAAPQFMTGEQRFQAAHRLWRILHRFLVYILRGGIPLSAGEFELLA